jgi:tRNA threonylcarbamoyladenosine biosynthesis protein TsaB
VNKTDLPNPGLHVPVPTPRLLIVETSTGRSGLVALADGPELRAVRRLDESRHHARDLAPAVRALLGEAGSKPRDVHAVLVSRGPGSYTGLRVGVMSAKAFAYATGCAVLGLETFAAIAAQAPREVARIDVLSDAQQDKVYVQPFGRESACWRSLVPLTIRRFADWLREREPSAWVTGPGLRKWEAHLPPGVPRLESVIWEPEAESLLRLGLARYLAGESDDLWRLEPIYLRPSSAEDQWQALGRT